MQTKQTTHFKNINITTLTYVRPIARVKIPQTLALSYSICQTIVAPKTVNSITAYNYGQKTKRKKYGI